MTPTTSAAMAWHVPMEVRATVDCAQLAVVRVGTFVKCVPFMSGTMYLKAWCLNCRLDIYPSKTFQCHTFCSVYVFCLSEGIDANTYTTVDTLSRAFVFGDVYPPMDVRFLEIMYLQSASRPLCV